MVQHCSILRPHKTQYITDACAILSCHTAVIQTGECILAYYSEFAVKRRFSNTCTGSAGTSSGSCDGGFACVNCNAGPVQKLNPILVVDALVADLVNRYVCS
jgi:hypothetical protein